MENIYQHFVHELKVCSPVTSCVLPAMPSTPLTRYPWWHLWCVPQNLDSVHDHMGRLSDGRGVRFLESLRISVGFENQWFHNCIKHTRTHARTHARTHTHTHMGHRPLSPSAPPHHTHAHTPTCMKQRDWIWLQSNALFSASHAEREMRCLQTADNDNCKRR